MCEDIILVNTHPGENPEFIGPLVNFFNTLGIESEIMDGYGKENPLNRYPSHIILSGVPLNAPYSLAGTETRDIVNRAFYWLPETRCPVLGICYGHQIMAHVFGGMVSSLKKTIKAAKLSIVWKNDPNSGIFSGLEDLTVFTEHRDYVSEIPRGFSLLCQKQNIPYIIYHEKKEMYGIQFVPELSDEDGRKLLKRFIGRQG